MDYVVYLFQLYCLVQSVMVNLQAMVDREEEVAQVVIKDKIILKFNF